MSEPTQPTPDAPGGPTLPPPIPHIPVARALSPADIAALRDRGRPGLITALGVMGIILGVAGVLFNASAALFATASMRVIRGVGGAGLHSVNGMYPAESQSVIAAFSAGSPLSPAQRSTLDAFLGEEGQLVFSRDSMRITPATVASMTAPAKPRAGGSPGLTFATTSGRLEIADDFAAFYPNTAATVAGGAPSVAEQKRAGEQIGSLNHQPLNPLQKSVLARELAAPGQGLIAPGAALPTEVAQLDDGGIIVHGAGRALWYIPAHITRAATASPPPPEELPGERSAAALAMAESVLSLGLSIFLIVIASMALRPARHTRLYHAIYALAKVPLVLAGTWAWSVVWMSYSRMGAMANGNDVQSEQRIMMILCIGAGAVFLIYPIAVLFVIRMRLVRDYFGRLVG